MKFKISIHKRPFDFSRSKKSQLHRYAKGWETIETDLAGLGEVMVKYVWSPIVFRGGYRHKSRFTEATICAIDNDDGEMTIDGAMNIFCEDYHVIGTTVSHQKEKTEGNTKRPACDRFRIALLFKRTVTDLEQYEYNMEEYAAAYNGDPSCKDGARLLIPCTKIISIVDNGEDLYKQPVKRLTPSAIERTGRARPNSDLPDYDFIEHTLTNAFEIGRKNTTCYQLGCEAAKAGIAPMKMVEMILSSPEYSSRDVDHKLRREIERAVSSGYKRYK